jgi:hypothetical protein
MAERLEPQEKKTQMLASRIAELKLVISAIDPHLLAERTGAVYSESPESCQFHFPFWSQKVSMAFPNLKPVDSASGVACGITQQALVMYYFFTADGSTVDNRWISFSELPDGRFYTQAFHSYTGREIANKFGQDRDNFRSAAAQAGGEQIEFADEAYAFQLFPRIKLAAALWLGDDEFPASAQILFNASTQHYLPTDACAIAGSMLTRMLINARSG